MPHPRSPPLAEKALRPRPRFLVSAVRESLHPKNIKMFNVICMDIVYFFTDSLEPVLHWICRPLTPRVLLRDTSVFNITEKT